MYQKRNNMLEVLKLFTGDYGREYYLREISKLSNIPVKTTQTALHRLEMERILLSSAHGKNKYFRLNLENIQTKLLLLQAEVAKETALLDKHPVFKPFVKAMQNDVPMAVFGSFAKGAAREHSDLDLLIIAESEPQLPLHLLPQRVQKVVLTPEHFTEALQAREALLQEVVEHHIILNNVSFFVNALWRRYG